MSVFSGMFEQWVVQKLASACVVESTVMNALHAGPLVLVVVVLVLNVVVLVLVVVVELVLVVVVVVVV
jgi:hypothetical protein